MKALDFVSTLKKIATEYKTLYVYGSFGAHLRSDNIERYLNKYAYNRKADRLSIIENSLDKGIFGFDCVCLVKGVLWGWNGDLDAHYGGAAYESNSVPDVGANRMIELCLDISEDFSDICVGELLWMKDHCGIYVGDGLAVECTPIWKDGVQLTALGNLEKPPLGYNQRKWTKHGKLPFVDYETDRKADDSVSSDQIGESETLPNLSIENADTNSNTPIEEKPSFMEILRRVLKVIISFFGG